MRKKAIAVILFIVLLTGCGGGNSAVTASESSTEASVSTETSVSNDMKEKEYKPVTCKFADSVETSSLYVDPVAGIPDDFYCGADVSTLLVQEASGVKYYDKDGNEADLLKLLSDGGVNYVRVRVWNDPFDASGHGYGGGNCTAETAAEIGRRAAEYGMKLCVDFHYSDFWADPGKQMVPKAWKGMEIHDKADAAYQFTLESMKKILDAGADVGSVQLGNEITGGLSGEKQVSFMALIMNGGAKAVRELSEERGLDIKLIAHLTNPEKADAVLDRVAKFKSNEVDYDILALSYYPYWHGTLENLTNLMKKIRDLYGKDVLVAETSYMYTVKDGDGTGNSVSEKNLVKEYAATVQSQANSLRDVCEAVVNAGGLGVFYWEPAWIPVGVYDTSQPGFIDIYKSNQLKWEEFGSGWASSYASEYDPNDAGRFYGGSSWDNQAWFDFYGKALDSLYTYRYLKYGTNAPLLVDYAEEVTVTQAPGKEIVLPDKAMAHFNDRSKNGEAKVTWNQADIDAVDINKTGDYVINGAFDDGYPAKCILTIANINLLSNPSFEESDHSMYKIEGNCGDYQQKETDAYTGEYALHYWSSNEVFFTATQSYVAEEDGTYNFSVYAQGGDSGSNPSMNIFVQVGDVVKKVDFALDGWINWKHPEVKGVKAKKGDTITVGVAITAGKGAWGTIDDFYLYKAE